MIKNSKVRKDIHSGSWYSDDAEELSADIEEALSEGAQAPAAATKYIISPHAGYAYALPTAGKSYRFLNLARINTVFILGPSHYLPLRGCGVDACETVKTPLGELPVDTAITAMLMEEDYFMEISKEDSETEHSIELQLPILNHMVNRAGANHVKVVPIMVGATDGRRLETIGRALLPYFLKEDTVFVISSDFCHFGRRFDFTRTGYEDADTPLWEAIRKLDLDGVKHILNHDLEGFRGYLKKTGNTICGRHPIEVLLTLIALSGMKLHSEIVSYAQSDKCKGLRDTSVSYCAIVGVQK